MKNSKYLSVATLTSYDNAGDQGGVGEGDLWTQGGSGGDGGQGTLFPKAPDATKTIVAPKVFSQDDVNKFMADEKRKMGKKFEELESAYKEALENQSLTSEQRGKLQEQLEDVQKRFRSKEMQLELDKKALEEKLHNESRRLTDQATAWESKFKTSVIERALLDAAVSNDAYSASQIVGLLRPMTRMVENIVDGQPTGDLVPVVEFEDIDVNTGASIMTRRAPEDAVRRMKELTAQYGNLFKSNVVSGIGSGSAMGGLAQGSDGRVDPRKLTTEQYVKLRKENPGALGFRKTPNSR
jgi:hypothetical protein